MSKILTILLLLLCAAPLAAEGGLKAKVTQLIGQADDFIVTLPDFSEAEAKVGAIFEEGTEITTNSEGTIALQLEGEVDGAPVPHAIVAIKPGTRFLLDKMAVSQDSISTRLAIKNGEVRVKLVEETTSVATDMKVSTPTATASVTGTDVHAIGYNANFGSYVQVASGSISSANANGQVRAVGGGEGMADGDSGPLGAALNASSVINAPFGMVTYEVTSGQLTFSGSLRGGADANNPMTNPSGARRPSLSDLDAGFNLGNTLPAREGRGNRR